MINTDMDIVKDVIIEKYIENFKTHEKVLSCIDEIYKVLYKIVEFNKKINKDLDDNEFEYIYDLNSKLEMLEEDFENHIYDPNYSKNLNDREKVYMYRRNMVYEIKNN